MIDHVRHRQDQHIARPGRLAPLQNTLKDLEFTHTNLLALPPDLHERQQPIACLYLEHSFFTAVLDTLVHLYATERSLNGSRIERLPELAHKRQYHFSFVVSASPLRELPDTLGEGTVLSNFSARERGA
ncbi:hypothetical protein PybrP1_011467 [[Pythium] brassicae (nom. inval.)]|nr:hypothetical protein PybrP1_011467 [[Pythium] brassicae (nom. inval.)]